jgi:hypothetical protein
MKNIKEITQFLLGLRPCDLKYLIAMFTMAAIVITLCVSVVVSMFFWR